MLTKEHKENKLYVRHVTYVTDNFFKKIPQKVFKTFLEQTETVVGVKSVLF